MEFNQKNEESTTLPNLMILICMTLLSIVQGAAAEETYSIIIHATNPTASLSSAEVMNMFLGKKVSWDDGKKIEIVTLKDSAIHQEFLKDYVKKTPQQFLCYWRQMLFAGKGAIPKTCDSEAEAVDFISKTPGSIGYVSTASSSAPGVKGIQINP